MSTLVMVEGFARTTPAKVVIPAAANSPPKSIPHSLIGARFAAKRLMKPLQQKTAK